VRTGMRTVPSAVSLERTSLIWLLASVLRRGRNTSAGHRLSSLAKEGAHISIEIWAR
jgi:hypothetical protein